MKDREDSSSNSGLYTELPTLSQDTNVGDALIRSEGADQLVLAGPLRSEASLLAFPPFRLHSTQRLDRAVEIAL